MYEQGMVIAVLYLMVMDTRPSIKDHEHQQRRGKTCADIQLSESVKAHGDQQTFLSNESNKSQFIPLLSKSLEDDGQVVHNSTGDTDTMIVVCNSICKRRERNYCCS